MNYAAAQKSAISRPWPMYLVSLGHGGTHWIQATFYTILPYVAADLGLTYTQIGFLLSLFHLSSAIANVPSGMIVDVTGRRVLYQALALALGGVALLCFSFSRQYWAFAAAVAVIGAANMLWHPAAISYLSIRYPDRRGLALAMHGLGANLGDALGPMAAGALLLVMSWNGTAAVNALLVILSAGLLFVLLERTKTAGGHEVAAASFRGYLHGMGTLLKDRAVWALCSMAAFRTAAQGGLLAFLPLYLAHDMQVNPFWMGFAMMVLQAGGAAASPVAGLLSDRMGRRPVVLAGLWATTVIIFALTFVTNAPLYIAGISMLGFFMYAVRPVIHSWMMDMSPPELGASITSLVFGTQSALTTLVPIVGGYLADRYGLISVFYLLAGMMLIANVLTLFVPRQLTAVKTA